MLRNRDFAPEKVTEVLILQEVIIQGPPVKKVRAKNKNDKNQEDEPSLNKDLPWTSYLEWSSFCTN